jgi:hypothetical protein
LHQPYNHWYTDTYDVIFQMADWNDFAKDVGRKVVCIFSWMPQTLMAISHTGKSKKWEHYSLTAVADSLDLVAGDFDNVVAIKLIDASIEQSRQNIEALCGVLFPAFGPSAASKYLHFSVPRFFPMWDQKIRKHASFRETSAEYIRYMQHFQSELMDKENWRTASSLYPGNPVRGWDIHKMQASR